MAKSGSKLTAAEAVLLRYEQKKGPARKESLRSSGHRSTAFAITTSKKRFATAVLRPGSRTPRPASLPHHPPPSPAPASPASGSYLSLLDRLRGGGLGCGHLAHPPRVQGIHTEHSLPCVAGTHRSVRGWRSPLQSPRVQGVRGALCQVLEARAELGQERRAGPAPHALHPGQR